MEKHFFADCPGCLGKSSKWDQERQKRVTPLFLELREGSEIAGKAGTWRKAMVGVTRVYPEQEGHPQNTARLLHTYKHSLKMCKQVRQALQRAKERPKQVSHLLLRSQVAFHCEYGALRFQGSSSVSQAGLTVSLAADLWVRRPVSFLGTRYSIGMYLLGVGRSPSGEQQLENFSVSKTLSL